MFFNVIPVNSRGAISTSYQSYRRIVHFYYLPIFQTELFCWEKLFYATQGRFFASRTFTWYQNCSRNQSSSGRPEARGQVRARPHTLSLPWHGIDYTIYRFQWSPYHYAKCLLSRNAKFDEAMQNWNLFRDKTSNLSNLANLIFVFWCYYVKIFDIRWL